MNLGSSTPKQLKGQQNEGKHNKTTTGHIRSIGLELSKDDYKTLDGRKPTFQKRTGQARVETRVLKSLVVWGLLKAKVDSVSARFKNARVEKMPLSVRMRSNVGAPCMSECVLKMLAYRGLHVGVCEYKIGEKAPKGQMVRFTWGHRPHLGLHSPKLCAVEAVEAIMQRLLLLEDQVVCMLCSCEQE